MSLNQTCRLRHAQAVALVRPPLRGVVTGKAPVEPSENAWSRASHSYGYGYTCATVVDNTSTNLIRILVIMPSDRVSSQKLYYYSRRARNGFLAAC